MSWLCGFGIVATPRLRPLSYSIVHVIVHLTVLALAYASLVVD